MKRLLSTCAMLLTAMGMAAQFLTGGDFIGTPCDKVKYRITYKVWFTADTTVTPQTWRNDQMVLDIGEKMSKFHNYSVWVEDSTIAASKDNQMIFGAPGFIRWEVYKNFPAKGDCTLTETIGLEGYQLDEKIEVPQWEIVPEKTDTILGIVCQMAKAQYKGRKWYAWYAEDIPIDDGPWKLSGLPGLILRAQDSQRHYVFKAEGIRQVNTDMDIHYKERMLGTKTEKISRKALGEIRKHYYADPVGYISNNPQVKVVGPRGQSKKQAYNPIER